jgi:hypothetical protein
MILNIILMVVFLKLTIDLFRQREGMDLELPVLNIKDCDYDINIIFPYYDISANLYTDKSDFMYHNYQNILNYASRPCDARTNK